MGRIIVVSNTGCSKKYYHSQVRHYQDYMTSTKLYKRLGVLFGNHIVLVNGRKMIYDNNVSLRGEPVYCIVDEYHITQLVKNNTLQLVDKPSQSSITDDDDSDFYADMPHLIRIGGANVMDA